MQRPTPSRLDALLADWRFADARCRQYQGLLHRFAQEHDSPPKAELQRWAATLREGEQAALAAVVEHVRKLETPRRTAALK